jgi:hypothetical protein
MAESFFGRASPDDNGALTEKIIGSYAWASTSSETVMAAAASSVFHMFGSDNFV